VVTADDLRDLPIFAPFSDDERIEIATRAADVHARAGEYLAQEGEEPYFYVVLDGTLNVTKRVGAGEIVLATRQRGEYFGETPALLGASTFANLLAVTASRLMRLDPFDLQALTARNAAFKGEILSSMVDRVAGIGARAMAKRGDAVLIIGHRWDLACTDTRTMLARNQVRHEFLVADAPGTRERIPDIAELGDAFPVVRLIDGRVLVQPSNRALAEGVGLQTSPKFDAYDAIVIGGGPGGLAAAVYGASEGLHTLMIEREAPGGQAGTSSRIENYLGFPTGLSGDDLASRALDQAKRLGAEVLVTRDVSGIDATTKTVTLDGGQALRARTIVLATGVTWRSLAVDGVDRLTGVGVYYGAARSEALNTTGKDIFLIGGGNSAGQAAMFFSGYARSVTILIRAADLAASMSDYLIRQLATKDNIAVEARSEVVALHGERHLEAIDVVNRATGATTRRATDALFVFIGADAETDWLPPEIGRDARGYVLTGRDAQPWPLERDPFLLETTVPGIFAVGDVRHASVKRVASAVGEGSMAIAFAHQYLAVTT
jgi:thioredoxin reductase (NADPH)